MMQKPRTETPIEEIHRIRRETSDRFGGDLQSIAADAARRQALAGRSVWQPRPRDLANPSPEATPTAIIGS